MLKDRPRREVDDIVTGIMLDNKEDINGVLLDWTKFDKRTKTDHDEGTNKSNCTLSAQKQPKSNPKQEDRANRQRRCYMCI